MPLTCEDPHNKHAGKFKVFRAQRNGNSAFLSLPRSPFLPRSLSPSLTVRPLLSRSLVLSSFSSLPRTHVFSFSLRIVLSESLYRSLSPSLCIFFLPLSNVHHGTTSLPLSNVQPRSHVSSLVERAPLEPPFAPVSQPEHTALPRTDFSRQRRTAAACPHTHTHLFSSHGVLIQQTPPCSTKPYTHTLYPHVCMHTHNMNFSLRRRNTTAQLQLKFVFHTHSMHTNTP